MIFDREVYLEILEKRARGLLEGYRQNIAIVGDELVGKTSLIFKFLKGFSDNRIIMAYLETRPESINSFARRFIGILLYNFLLNSGIPLKEDLDFLIRKADKFIPKTVAGIKKILSAIEKRKKSNIFTDLFSLTESINQETGKLCIVILDEFQSLENLGIKCLYREWSKLLITQKNTMYIITSSMKFKAKNILSKHLSLLFGNFEVINIEPFDIKTSEEFLKHKLQGKELARPLRDFITHFTGGYPLYLEVITDCLLKHAENNLPQILESLLFQSCGILNQRFSSYIKRIQDSPYSGDYISILYLIASGRNKVKDIAHILRKTKKELALRVNRLLELDTVTKSGDFLKVNDRVFGFWLKFVYQGSSEAFTFDAKNQKEKFRDNIEDMIRDFYLNSQKPVVQRLTEVLRLFEDDLVQVERKKVRLNHFREIKPLEFNNRNLKEGLLGRSNDSLWIMAFKNEVLTEDDITEFSKECRKFRHKLQRRIIVTLRDIDSNTRLRALEEKIWTWDINNINQILDLFSKPWVIA